MLTDCFASRHARETLHKNAKVGGNRRKVFTRAKEKAPARACRGGEVLLLQRLGSFSSRCRSEFLSSTISPELIGRSFRRGAAHEKLEAALMSPEPL